MKRINYLPKQSTQFYIWQLLKIINTNSFIISIVPSDDMSHNHQKYSKPFNGINIFKSFFHKVMILNKMIRIPWIILIVFLFTITYYLSWYTSNNCIRRYILCNYSPGSNYCPPSDVNTWQNYSTRADPRI